MEHTSATHQDGFATSFEYLALVFLILTFVVGAVYTPTPLLGTGEQESNVTEPTVVGTFSPRFAFSGRGARVNGATLNAIAHILTTHDIEAEISLFLDREAGLSAEAREQSTMRALARAVSLTRALSSRGVRSRDLRVVVVPVVRSRTLQVRMRKELRHG